MERGGSILENDYTETQQWILEVWKLMSTNQITISHVGPELSREHTHDALLRTYLFLEGNFPTS